MKRVVSPGGTRFGRLYVMIEITKKEDRLRLSLMGVEGPLPNGDARGSCGQIVESLTSLHTLDKDWTPDMVKRLAEVWLRWHLNDMRAGCEHQRGIDTKRQVEVVTYSITHAAQRRRDKVRQEAADAALAGVAFCPTDRDRALGELTDWYKERHQLPTGVLADCFEATKHQMKAIGWVRPDEHPEGLLGKPCEVCGYQYGTKWLYEKVPDDVLAWLEQLPEADGLPARWF